MRRETFADTMKRADAGVVTSRSALTMHLSGVGTLAMAYPIAPGVRFKSIEGHPGYCVGDDGSVWSCVLMGVRRGVGDRWRRLRPHQQHRGHCAVDLGRKATRFVHRLVLEAFVGPCPEGQQCRHLDGNPLNNQLSNLAWGTPRENHADSVRHGTAYHLRPEAMERMRAGSPGHPRNYVRHKAGEGHHRAKLSDEQVAHIRRVVDPSKRDGTASRLAKEWGVTSAAVMMIAKGLRRCTG